MEFSEVLKNLREKKGISISQLASLTGIEEEFLKALEEKNWELLPPDIYIQGYLKKISQVLEVDFEDLWGLYRIQKKELYFSGKRDLFPEIKTKKSFLGVDWGKLIWVGLVLLGCFYIGLNLRGLFLPPQLQVTKPAFDFVSLKEEIEIEGKTNAHILLINGKEVPLEEDGSFFYKFSLMPGLNILRIEAKNYFGRSKIIERKVIYKK